MLFENQGPTFESKHQGLSIYLKVLLERLNLDFQRLNPDSMDLDSMDSPIKICPQKNKPKNN
jgi:hypothetical protein